MIDLDAPDRLSEARARLEAAMRKPPSRHTYPLPTAPVVGAPQDLHAAGGEASLYLHVPYCSVRCTYCFFVTQIGHGANDMASYVDEAIKELALLAPAMGHYRFTSMYYGGGTPGLLPPALFEKLHEHVAAFLAPGATVTVETHPHAADAQRVATWKRLGIDRVSMGVQTTDSQLLELINRDLTESHILPGLARLLEAGFDDVNVDLLYGLPEQSLASWQETLEAMITTGVPSISAYRTSFIPATAAAFAKRGADLPEAETAALMYAVAFARLNEAGFDQPRYGASCFSRKCYDAGLNDHRRHVLDGKAMVGVGMGAFGSVGGYTYMNHRDRKHYQAALTADKLPVLVSQPVPREERPYKYAVETWKQGFLSAERYRARFGETVESRFYTELAALREAGLVTAVDGEYRFTQGGSRHPDAVAEMFTSPAARRYAEREAGGRHA